MTYIRVLPRDLFNEAKLLKCIGKLTLLIEDGKLPWLKYHYDGEGFVILQNFSDGSIFIGNIEFYSEHDGSDVGVHFYTPLNDRADWPLMMRIHNEEFYVFQKNGELLIDADGTQAIAVMEAQK